MKTTPHLNSDSQSPALRRFVSVLATVVMLLGLVFIALEWDNIRLALSEASWEFVPLALATTVISYFCISLSFAVVCRMLGIEMKSLDLMSVGFISVVLNHIVASGGAAGYSVRYSLMSRHGVTFNRVLAVSILHFVLISMVMIGVLPFGLLHLVNSADLPQSIERLMGALVVLVIALDALGVALVFSQSLRSRLFGIAENAIRVVLRRDPGETLQHFDATMSEGSRALLQRPLVLVGLLFLVVFDWIASAATLWIAFLSLGVVVPPASLISGFVIGIVTGVASLVPGGLGVQEGTMAGVFAMLGLDFGRAVLAAVFYRFIYFIIPYIVSLGAYRWIMSRDRKSLDISENGVGHAHPHA